jgi:hypothetical protein
MKACRLSNGVFAGEAGVDQPVAGFHVALLASRQLAGGMFRCLRGQRSVPGDHDAILASKTFQDIGHNDLAHRARLPASAAETWRAVTKISLVKEEPASPISFLTPDAP